MQSGPRTCFDAPHTPRAVDASRAVMGCSRRLSRAFTLIELMLVVAVMGILLAIGIPSLVHVRNHESFTGIVADVVDVCSRARAVAVLHGSITEVAIFPQDGRFQMREIGGGEAYGRELQPGEAPPRKTDTGGLSDNAQLSSHASIEMLDVNFIECKDALEADVHFYPNGTSDCFTLILREAQGEWRTISLEEVTGLAVVKETAENAHP